MQIIFKNPFATAKKCVFLVTSMRHNYILNIDILNSN